MLLVRNLSLLPGEGEDVLLQKAAKKLNLPPNRIRSLRIVKRSLDSRFKPDIRVVHTVALELEGKLDSRVRKKEKVEEYNPVSYQIPNVNSSKRPVVVGMGPAGLFSALILARAGLKPLLLERGEAVDARFKKVRNYWENGILDEESNVQFGEGGAGTFSDGKLNTGIRDLRISFVLETFRQMGANEAVTYDAKPHVGTDVLSKIVVNIRNEILSLGGEVVFSAKFCDFSESDNCLQTVSYLKNNSVHTVETNYTVLALGHSAHDTFSLLYEKGVSMRSMPFAIGVRIEHPQGLIDRSQYGEEALSRYRLPPAEYKLSYQSADGGKVHSFCMCPGGYVVASSSRKDAVVTNGMSNSSRDAENANSALLISPLHLKEEDPLAGIRYQQELEHRSFRLGGCNHFAPAQLVGDFLDGRASTKARSVQPTYRPGVKFCDLRALFDPGLCDLLKEAILWMDTRIKGFAHPDAVLTAPESRSSSPVRILRDENRHSSVRGLIPCGEGAGYAGGIVSAAVDGILCAETVLSDLSSKG